MTLYDIYSIFSNPVAIFPMIFAVIFGISDIMKMICRENNTVADELLSEFSFFTRKILIVLINLFFVLAILFSNNHFVIALGCDDLRAMPEGTYCYYILATNENDKTYTLPAKINKIGFGEYDIENVYFENGGWLYFDDGDYFDYGDSYSNFDQNGKEWHLELTSNKAKHEKVTEEKNFTLSIVIFLYALAFEFLLAAILHIIHLIKGYKLNQ